MGGNLGEPVLDGPWRGTPGRYAIAVLCVVAGVIVAELVHPVVDATVFLLTAVLISAWFSGLAPTLLASLLATLALDYFFTEPLHTLNADPAHLVRLALFATIAILFAGAGDRRRRIEWSLRQLRDQLETKVQERTAELEELAGRLIRAQEEERSRIGRELHDHISQMLGVLTIKMDQLRMASTTPPAIAASLQDLRTDTTQITEEVHGLSHRLHSSALDYLGLVPALQRLVSEFSTRHGIEVEFTHSAIPDSLGSDVALCLFRITEESLTNIAKHSGAKSAHIHVKTDSNGISLTIADSGDGFDPAALERKAGLGFVSMRERLRALRGVVRVDSAPSRGTKIDAWVPADGRSSSPSAEVMDHHSGEPLQT
jgi:signal transduction histidine kinase